MLAALRASRARRLWPEIACGAFLVAVALAWCAPAVVHGTVFGSYDAALSAGVGSSLVTSVHDLFNGDQGRQDAVWTYLDWVSVHHGSFPLWNPYSDLGLPELANFQSGAASLPSILGYLFPLSLAYTVEVVAKLVIGGLGCFVAARVLGASRTSALLAGVVGELSGPMAAWSGWPQTGVAEWSGWVVAAVVLACRAPRWRYAVLLAVVVAFACTGGFPEVLALLALAAAVVAVVVLAGDGLSRARRARAAPLGRRAACLLGGVLAGVLLAAPIWLPSIPVLRLSVSSLRAPQGFLPWRVVALLVDPSYWGLPSSSSTWFGPFRGGEYFETAAFVGAAVLCCAVLALLRRWRDPAVLGLVVAVVVLAAVVVGAPPLREILLDLPGVRTIAFGRGLLVLCDLLGVLAALGLDELTKARAGRIGWAVYGLFGAATVAALAVSGSASGLTPPERALRVDGMWLSFAGMAALGIVLVGRQLVARRTRRVGSSGHGGSPLRRLADRLAGRLGPLSGALVVTTEAVVLVLASFTVPTWSRTYLPQNAPLAAYVSSTTGGLVALGGGHASNQPPRLGIYPELNAAYQVRELAGYDAVTPRALYALWERVAPAPDLAATELAGDITQFAPDVETAAEARALGVSYLIAPLHGSLRLVDGANGCVSRALAGAGEHSSATTNGVLDDLEWLVEQPGLLRDFPERRAGFVGRYLAAEAAAPPPPAVPTALGRAAATEVASLVGHDAALPAALETCLTVEADPALVRVATLGREVLYRVPGVAGAYFARRGSGSVDSSLRYTGDASASVTATARRASWLELTVDYEPGWSATTGSGEVLATRRAGALVEVRLPPGRHVVVLRYWPEYLSLGLGLAGATVVALVAGGLLARRRRWRRS